MKTTAGFILLVSFFILTDGYAQGLVNITQESGLSVNNKILHTTTKDEVDLECSYTDASGNIYLAGFANSLIDFADVFYTQASTAIASPPTAGTGFFYMVKFNSTGVYQAHTFLYSNRAATSGDNYTIRGITTDATGNIYITGVFMGTYDFDGGAGTTNLTSIGNKGDVFVAKYSSSLALSWAKKIGPTNATNNYAIAEDIAVSPTTGNVWITGTFLGASVNSYYYDLDPGAGTVALAAGSASTCVFAGVYNGTNGNYVSFLYGENNEFAGGDYGSSNPAQATALAINSAGKVYITGTYTDSFGGNCGNTLTTAGLWPFIWVYDPSNSSCTITGYSDTRYYDIDIDANSNVIVGGISSSGGVLRKFNSAMTLQWSKSLWTQIQSVTTDASNNVYAVGEAVSADAYAGDLAIQKYSSAGATQYGSTGFTIPVANYIGFRSYLKAVEPVGSNILIGGYTTCNSCIPTQDIGFDLDQLTITGDNNGVYTQFWGIYQYDNIGPTGTITSLTSSPTNLTSIPLAVAFDQEVTGYDVFQHMVTDGELTNFVQIDSKNFTMTYTPNTAGFHTIEIATGGFYDYHNNINLGSNALEMTFDYTKPTVTITSTASDPTNISPIPVTVTFSESVSGFVLADIGVTNGVASNFAAVSGSTYTASVTPSGTGIVTVSISANLASDAAGNLNTAAANLTRNYNGGGDTTPPTVTVSSTSPDPTNTLPIPVTFTFSESVTGFVVGDITVINGSAGSFSGSGTTYTANITPSGQGAVTVSVTANKATDAAGNNNTASNTLSRTFDSVHPDIVISSASSSPTSTSPIPLTFTFSESVTGFISSDIVVSGGILGNFSSSSGSVYTAYVTPLGSGTITANVAANVALDGAGNNNTAATQFSIIYNSPSGTVQYASSIIGYSSQYTASTWSALQALGAPNVYPACTDNSNAWTSSTMDGQREFLKLGFSTTMTVSKIEIYETNAAGFVDTVYLRNASTGVWNQVYSASASATACRILTINLTETSYGVDAIRIAVNSPAVAGWNEIDAVAITGNAVDVTPPSVTVSSTTTDPTNTSPIPVTITFSESVTGFVVGDITVTNGSAGSFSGSGATYTASITPSGQGAVTISITANKAADAAGNNNTASNTLSRTFDSVAPTVTVLSTATDPTNTSPIPVTITFSEIVTGFVVGDITVTNGSAGSFSGNGTTYTASITPSGQGAVTVSVTANKAADAAGNNNTASNTISRTFDSSAPTVTISSTSTDPTNTSPIPVTITFSESVTSFVLADITVTNGSVGSFSGSGTTYTASITPSGQGSVTVSVAANVAIDAAGNNNTVSNTLSRTFDSTAPTVTITSSATDPTNNAPIPVTITFSEIVTGFVVGDITVTNGSAGSFSGSGTTYTASITPSGQGAVTVSVTANKAADAAGNNNTASNTLSRTFDSAAPTVTISSAAIDPTNTSPIPVTITFSESVTGFVLGDITVTNGSAGSFGGSGTTYTVNITPSGQGSVSVSVAANMAIDAAGNNNTASNTLGRTFDSTAPTVTVSSTSTDPTNTSPIPVTITFSETVTGFVVGDITVTNGSAGSFSGSGTTYTASITPSGQGAVTVSVTANKAADAAGNNNNASNTLSRTFDSTAPTVTVSSTSTDPTNTSPIPVTITFSESVTGFVSSDLSVSNGTVGSLSGSGTTYTASIIPSSTGSVGVSIIAGVAIDLAGNSNTASNTVTRNYTGADTSSPVVTVTSSTSDPTNSSPIPVTITFSETVTGFVVGDITVTNGSTGGFSGSGTTYTVNITPTNQGVVTVSVASNVAIDGASNGNNASNTLSRTFDTTVPTVAISSGAADPTNVSPIPVTITFSESVTGFVVGDISVTNGSTGGFSGSGTTYTVNITPTNQGVVTVSVASNVAIDGASNGNTASNTLRRTFDTSAPTVVITSSATDPTSTSPIPVTITFSESVTGFVVGDITVTNGSTGGFSGSGTTYTVNITPTNQGAVTVSVASNVAIDVTSNGNTASNTLSRTFDSVVPTVNLTSSALDPTNSSSIPVTITFSESVTGFALGDITVTNGSVENFSGSGTTYTATVIAANQGTVSVSVASFQATDEAGNGNSTSNTLNRIFDSVAPTVTISSTSADPTSTSPIPVKITFSESVTGFVIGDITITNGSIGNFSGSGSTYTAEITPATSGTVTVNIASSVTADGAGNGNTLSAAFTRNYTGGDTTSPTVAITSSASDPTNASPIPVTITFSENVAGFVVGDITVTNGSAGSFSGSGTTYTASITPTNQGVVAVTVSANTAVDGAGNNNAASNTLSWIFDSVSPTVTISSTSSDLTKVSPIPVTITFSESVANFVVDDITFTNGVASGFSGSGTTYTVNVTPTNQGAVAIAVAANQATDAAGNSNAASNSLSRTFDSVSPTVTISSTSSDPTSTSPIPVTIVFSESVTGFAIGDISITNGTAGNFSGSGSTYNIEITPSSPGIVTAVIATMVSADAAGNGNTASNTLSRTFQKQSQTITFATLADKTLGDAPFNLTASASSGLTVSFTSANDKVSILGNTVTLEKAGLATILADQSGNTQFNQAAQVSQSFCIKPAKPTISLSGDNTETPSLSSSSSSGNQWFKNGSAITGATNQSLSITEPGTYTVQVTTETCVSAISNDFIITVTGLESIYQLSVSPNPSASNIRINIPGGKGGIIKIVSMDGRVEKEQNTAAAEETINIADLNAGTKLIRVVTPIGNFMSRFIKI